MVINKSEAIEDSTILSIPTGFLPFLFQILAHVDLKHCQLSRETNKHTRKAIETMNSNKASLFNLTRLGLSNISNLL